MATFTWEHNDFFLRRLPLSSDASKLSAFNASQQQRGELSYYYAHNRGVQPLVSQAPAPVEERAPLSQRPAPAGAVKFNSKQSPFGTNINQYETITSYTWEDKDGDTVKVLVSVEGVGRLIWARNSHSSAERNTTPGFSIPISSTHAVPKMDSDSVSILSWLKLLPVLSLEGPELPDFASGRR